MAMRIHLGMINDDAWGELVDEYTRDYGKCSTFTEYMKQRYHAIEIYQSGAVNTSTGDFRVFEFNDKEKYMEFCLRWL
jgi:hypothetical protein